MASVNANPSRRVCEELTKREGLRAMADTKLANTRPTPTPAPLMLIVANPAPINLADSSAILIVLVSVISPNKCILA